MRFPGTESVLSAIWAAGTLAGLGVLGVVAVDEAHAHAAGLSLPDRGVSDDTAPAPVSQDTAPGVLL
ncbi:hypothetical protein [Streptomyces brevispora]|uniref:Uncharacterized protein n=1 Tax=Streptomyces brevispora TaxID=887462 RepID=A0ABZ1FYN7_9ACTN|nr:hypothetical protein [Streptomyces brevispora]WSC12662.1 hypothetical protein OIE64_07295 [Streptomyces brevispora]